MSATQHKLWTKFYAEARDRGLTTDRAEAYADVRLSLVFAAAGR